MYEAKNKKDWDNFIPLILSVQRTSISEAIGASPWTWATPSCWYLVSATSCRRPLDFSFRSSQAHCWKSRIGSKSSSWEFTAFTAQNERILRPFFDPALRPIETPVDDDPSEPYLDESDIPADSFEVSKSSSRDNDTNVTAEKHDACSPSHSQEALESSNQQLDDDQVVIDNQSIFAVERILEKRKRKGKMQYKVKWLGYPEEPEENILDKSLIEHFEHGQGRNQRKSNPQHVWITIFHLLHFASILCQLSQVVSINR